jgi:hypothetical protein
VRTALSAAHAYGWDELLQSGANPAWVLDAYLPFGALSALQEELNRRDVDDTDEALGREPVLLLARRTARARGKERAATADSSADSTSGADRDRWSRAIRAPIRAPRRRTWSACCGQRRVRG